MVNTAGSYMWGWGGGLLNKPSAEGQLFIKGFTLLFPVGDKVGTAINEVQRSNLKGFQNPTPSINLHMEKHGTAVLTAPTHHLAPQDAASGASQLLPTHTEKREAVRRDSLLFLCKETGLLRTCSPPQGAKPPSRGKTHWMPGAAAIPQCSRAREGQPCWAPFTTWARGPRGINF